MTRTVRLPRLRPISIAAATAAVLVSADALADSLCSGHKLLTKPRPEVSCRNVVPEIFVSPDRTLRALVFPSDISLDATPDMESRVVIRSSGGDTVTSRDYSSPRGANGYFVDNAKWSPDSQFFVYSMMSSGGHSPWSFPIMVYSRKQKRIAPFSDMIGGYPTLSGDFKFSGPHTLVATTWKQTGALDDKVPISVDLDAAFEKLPPAPD
jgi:hypothetical protein